MSETSPKPEPVAEPEPEPVAAPAPVKKTREKKPMSDKQKADLSKHMEKMKKGGMDSKEMKSHRMKVMSRMRKGMSVGAAHKDAMK